MKNTFDKAVERLTSRGVCPILARELCKMADESPGDENTDFLMCWAEILFIDEVAGDVETV